MTATKNLALIGFSAVALLFAVFSGAAPSEKEGGKAEACREALDRAETLMVTNDALDEGMRWRDVAVDVCRGVREPDLRVRAAVATAHTVGGAHEGRLYLDREFPSLEAAAGPMSLILLPLLDELLAHTLYDGCDIPAAREWAERADAIRRQRPFPTMGDAVELVAKRGDHAYGLATCYLEENRAEAEREFELAESAYREVYALLLETRASDEERFEALGSIRIVVEELGRTLEAELADEHQRLMFKLYSPSP